jgi:hypothetical protein
VTTRDGWIGSPACAKFRGFSLPFPLSLLEPTVKLALKLAGHHICLCWNDIINIIIIIVIVIVWEHYFYKISSLLESPSLSPFAVPAKAGGSPALKLVVRIAAV